MEEEMNRLEQGFHAPIFSRPARLMAAGLVMAVIGLTTFSEAWALQTSPTSLTFQAVQGGPNPSSQVVILSKSNAKQVSWNSRDNANWLSASPTSGTMTTSTQVMVTVNAGGLAAGTYNGNVTIALSRGGNVSVPVTLTVAPPSSTGTSSTGTTSTTSTTASLSWNTNTETDLAGYKVYVGTSSGLYGSPIDVGKATSYVMANLKVGNTYYFSVTAYDTSGNESLHSSEVSKSVY